MSISPRPARVARLEGVSASAATVKVAVATAIPTAAIARAGSTFGPASAAIATGGVWRRRRAAPRREGERRRSESEGRHRDRTLRFRDGAAHHPAARRRFRVRQPRRFSQPQPVRPPATRSLARQTEESLPWQRSSARGEPRAWARRARRGPAAGPTVVPRQNAPPPRSVIAATKKNSPGGAFVHPGRSWPHSQKGGPLSWAGRSIVSAGFRAADGYWLAHADG